jgi:uracil-DNA glycosylase family protein
MKGRTNLIGTAAPLIPPRSTLNTLRQAAAGCRACDLWRKGTQTVFGEGNTHSKVMFVGEQPGEQEDIIGRPFIGRAGKLFDEVLMEAGINRADVYVTNLVKHFNRTWAESSGRRIHKKPNASEIKACRPWLDAELAVMKPEILICLGAFAAQSLLGKEFSVTQQHGKFINSPLAQRVMATFHPSSILRAWDRESRQKQRGFLVEDLKKIAQLLSQFKAAS